MDALAAIPSELYDYDCVTPNCAVCLNQTVIYRVSLWNSLNTAATDIFDMTSAKFSDFCLVCAVD